MKLKGKVALITGAGAGIGKSTAILFSREGAKLSCNSLTKSALKVSEEIKNLDGNAIFVRGDVSNEKEAENIVEKTIETYGKIDILFNNAGIVIPGSIDTISTKDWDRTMAVNIRGIYLVSKYAIPYLKKTQGCIVNNASVLALKGVKDRAAYSASKGAVLSLTKAMAADYMENKIRVNVICPGTTDTPSLAERLSKFDNPEEARQLFIARQKMGRLGTPEEIAEGVLFFVLNEFCTGICLSIDGGMTI